jgi:hypothetical protein
MTRPAWPAILLLIATAASGATLQITGPAGGTVRLEDHPVGALPLNAPLQLPRGTYTVTCEAAGYQACSETVILGEDDAWVHLHLRPVRLTRSTAMANNLLFAGLGQLYMGARWRGWLYVAGEAGGLLTAVAGEAQRVNDRDDYKLYLADYQAAIDPDQIDRYRKLAQASFQGMRDGEDQRDLGLMIAGGAIALSLLDAWLFCPHAEAPAPVTAGLTALPGEGGLGAVVRLSFGDEAR